MNEKYLYTVIVRSAHNNTDFKYMGTFDDKEKAYNAISNNFRFWGSEVFHYYEVLQDGQDEYLIIEQKENVRFDIQL